MIRALALFAALALATSATAQTAYPELERASHAVAAIWRPIDPAHADTPSLHAACAGWEQEMSGVDAALPTNLTAEALAQIRAPRGLIIVPTADDPASAFIFPNAQMAWVTSGLGRISVLAPAEGYVSVEDAAGHSFTLQLGRQGQAPLMRVRTPEGGMMTFVGCAPTQTP